MKMKVLSSLLALSLMIPPQAAHASRSMFDPRPILASVRMFYECHQGQCSDRYLEELGVAKIGGIVAEDIAGLRADRYNALLLKIADDYATRPELRPAIEMLYGLIYAKVAQELKHRREWNPLDPILNGLIVGLSVGAIATGGLRALKKARGTTGTMTRTRFQNALRSAKRKHAGAYGSLTLKVGAGGAAVGTVQAAMIFVSTRKLNPLEILRGTREGVARMENPGLQRRIVDEYSADIAATRDFLDAIDPEDVRRNPEMYSDHLKAAEDFLIGIEEEVHFFYETAAPDLGSRILAMGAEVIQPARMRIERLKASLPMKYHFRDDEGIGALPAGLADSLDSLDELTGDEEIESGGPY